MTERLEQLEKLYGTDPNDPFVTYGIALEHFKQGRHDEAITWLDKTLEIDAKYCYAYYQKAKVLSDLGDDSAAVSVLQMGMNAAQEAGDDHAREEMAELLQVIG